MWSKNDRLPSAAVGNAPSLIVKSCRSTRTLRAEVRQTPGGNRTNAREAVIVASRGQVGALPPIGDDMHGRSVRLHAVSFGQIG
jgi:hypothetical protein